MVPTVAIGRAAADPGGPWVIIHGRGFGHGVGMAQDGAYWMGRQGRSAAEILRLFFPGTTLGTRGGNVRVPLGGGSSVRLDLPAGGTVGGHAVPVGSSVTARVDGGTIVATIGAPKKVAPAAPVIALLPIAFRTRSAFRTQSAPSSPAVGPAVTAPVDPVALSEPGTVVVGLPPSVGADSSAAASAAGSAVATTAIPSSPSPSSPSPSPPGEKAQGEKAPIEPSSTTGPSTPDPTNTGPTNTDPTNTGPTDNGPTDTVRGSPLLVEPTDGTATVYGGRAYRGRFELRPGGGVRVVNELDVEQYLRGMGEITDARWPAAALEAQAIAARTYAFRTMAAAGEVCPTQRCQVYFGVRAEYSAMDRAVAATRGRVVTYDRGKLAITFYSASGGGTIASPEEAFGGKSEISYLQPGTYPTGDLKSWVVTVALDELGRRVGYRGRPSGVAVTRVGPSGRATEVTVTGSGLPLTIPGPRFDAALGLRSTFFTLTQAASPSASDSSSEPAGEAVEVLALGRIASTGNSQVLGAGGAASDAPLEFSQTGLVPDDTAVVISDSTSVDTTVPEISQVTDTSPASRDQPSNATPAPPPAIAPTASMGTPMGTPMEPSVDARVEAGGGANVDRASESSSTLTEVALVASFTVPVFALLTVLRRRRR